MSYQSATACVKGLNAANYLGHSNWQIPDAPIFDPGCSFTGPQNNSFGWNCSASALGFCSTPLWLKAPNNAVVVPNIKAGPFSNPAPCVLVTNFPSPANRRRRMSFNSADQFIKNMTAAACLGQSKWQLPPADANCAASIVCSVVTAPFQSLFYTQLGLTPGTRKWCCLTSP